MKQLIKYVFFVLYALFTSCAGCTSTRGVIPESVKQLKNESQGIDIDKYLTLPNIRRFTYVSDRDLDLKGDTLVIPEGVTLRAEGGHFMNGALVGNHTKIDGKEAIFDNISILGVWNVPEIQTSMFVNLDNVNSLRNVFALCNDKIHNKVTIDKGKYWVSVEDNETALSIVSETDVDLEGDIYLLPNRRQQYFIFSIYKAQNVSITGKGTITGDKFEHEDTIGEWGMGIRISNSKDIKVSGVTIKNCWGDCIYVGNESRNISIYDCILDNGRRQGISITSADSVLISDCIISRVSGTAPQYAVDIEPNVGQTVKNVAVRNVKSVNCIGAFEVWGKAEESIVMDVVISNCSSVGSKSKYPFLLMTANNVTVEGCYVDSNTDYAGSRNQWPKDE